MDESKIDALAEQFARLDATDGSLDDAVEASRLFGELLGVARAAVLVAEERARQAAQWREVAERRDVRIAELTDLCIGAASAARRGAGA